MPKFISSSISVHALKSLFTDLFSAADANILRYLQKGEKRAKKNLKDRESRTKTQ